MRKPTLKKITLSYFLNFCFLFFAILDPTRTIFHLTEIFMFLCFFVNIRTMNYKYFSQIIFCVAFWFISLGFSMDGQKFDISREISLLTSYSFLFFLLLSNKTSNKTFYCFYRIGKIMSIIVIYISLLYMLSPDLAVKLIEFFSIKNSTIMFSSAKNVVFFTMISVFYRTSPMIVLLLSFSIAKFLESKTKRFFIDSILFALCLFFSATRANVLSTFLIIGIVFLLYLNYIKKSKYLFPFLLLIFFSGAFLIILHIFMQKSEPSLTVKRMHLDSTLFILSSHPIRSLFVGFGPGSYFWTNAWGGQWTSQTELSYLELIRNYGLIGGIGISAIFLLPLISIFSNKSITKYYKMALSTGYIAYLFIAGTNPFLNCATGYLTLSIFTYMANNNVVREIESSYGNCNRNGNLQRRKLYF